jgi:5'(3')-deoxyribonucleotidase
MRIKEVINEAVDQKAEIYVDMDGVLADFFGVWTKMVGVKNWKEVKDVDSALDMIRAQKDFWINLPLTSNASKLLNSIKKVKGNYTILSSPLPDDPNSEPQKREWVKKMLSGFAPKRVIITHNKSAYAKQPDGTPNILIDDYGDNIQKWESAGGIGIQHSDKNADATVSKLEEGDFVTDISRFMNRAIRPGFYEKAAKAFHEWLKGQGPSYRHSLGYYAMTWGNRYKGMDWRNLKQAYEVMFGDDVLVESKEPKLVKDKKLKNLKSMDKPTRYERRKNYAKAEEDVKDNKKKEND